MLIQLFLFPILFLYLYPVFFQCPLVIWHFVVGKQLHENLSLSRPWKHIGGKEVELHTFLTSALDTGEWSASHSSYLVPG
jgi:hypothetical protein